MRVRVEYRGRVQGVGFRATVRSLAAGLPVTGWVRNEPDGAVLMEAQGEPGEVGRLEQSIASEMAGYIRSADRSVITDLPDERGFQIRR